MKGLRSRFLFLAFDVYVARMHWQYIYSHYYLSCFDAVGWRQEGHLACKKTEWWGTGVVICLEHMVQLMPLPPHYLLLHCVCCSTAYHNTHTHTTVLRPFFRDHPGEPVPEENLWTLWCKRRLTEADTLTIRPGAIPSGPTIAHLHHPIFYRPDALPAAQPTVSKHWRQLAHSD